jgi:hypothetical protein
MHGKREPKNPLKWRVEASHSSTPCIRFGCRSVPLFIGASEQTMPRAKMLLKTGVSEVEQRLSWL